MGDLLLVGNVSVHEADIFSGKCNRIGVERELRQQLKAGQQDEYIFVREWKSGQLLVVAGGKVAFRATVDREDAQPTSATACSNHKIRCGGSHRPKNTAR